MIDKIQVCEVSIPDNAFQSMTVTQLERIRRAISQEVSGPVTLFEESLLMKRRIAEKFS